MPFASEANKMNCISRTDGWYKYHFQPKNSRKARWNLHSEIAIENSILKCARENYTLTDICSSMFFEQPCTLLNSKEVVDIGMDFTT